MLGRLVRRIVDGAVLCFAAYAFAFVPLGKRTALEHLTAVLDTAAARSAGNEIRTAFVRLVGRGREMLNGHAAPESPAWTQPVTPELPDIAQARIESVPSGFTGSDAGADSSHPSDT